MAGSDAADSPPVVSDSAPDQPAADKAASPALVDSKGTSGPDFVTAETLELGTAAALPKGTVDPIYEAKARVLNNAVSNNRCVLDTVPSGKGRVHVTILTRDTDPGDRNGMVSMAAFHCCWLRMGER